MIRVLVVDDSAVLRQSTRLILESDPDLSVIGEARDGVDAVSLVDRLKPDVITMDLHMPKMDGLQAIEQIMAKHPAPIIVVTSANLDQELGLGLRASKCGALSVLQRPARIAAPDYLAFTAKLIEQVKLMSTVKVVRRVRTSKPVPPDVAAKTPMPTRGSVKPEIVAIGSSTGGPAALHKIISAIPADFPVPIVIVQHISFGFVQGLAEWLDAASPLHVKVAQPGEKVRPGTAYVAPDGDHMGVDRSNRIALDPADPISGHRPSVTALFRSIARSYGASAIAAILTGMGADGAIGMKALHDAGAFTLAQDEASCVVFGMPKEAIALGAAQQIVALDQIAPTLVALVAARVPV